MLRRTTVGLLLSWTVTLLAGCDSPDKVKQTTQVCLSPEEIAFRVPKNAKLSPEVDYAEMVRQRLELDMAKPERAYGVKVYGAYTIGTKCKRSKNEAACMATLAVSPSKIAGSWQGLMAGGGTDALMIRATRVEDVATIVLPDEAKTVFLPIDTPEEAAVIALGKATATQLSERTVRCDGPPVELRGDGSYVVTAEIARCSGPSPGRFEQRVRVERDGKTSVLGEKKLGECGGDSGKSVDGGH